MTGGTKFPPVIKIPRGELIFICISDNKAPNRAAEDIFLISTTQKGVTAEKWKYIIGYYENGRLRDTLFDGFMIVPELSYVYSHSPECPGYKRLNKSDWYYYVHSIMLKDGYNLDALEEAMSQLKNELKAEKPEICNYKAEVYLPILRLTKETENWGEVNGREIDCKNNEDRIAALKWLIDEEISAIRAKNYKHIKIGAAYHTAESLSNDADDAYVSRRLTDYIRSLGLTTLWVPYYAANGWNRGREYGFDTIVLQANFFPGTTLPNAGGIERLEATAKNVTENGYLMEMEFCGSGEVNVSGIKEYFKTAIKYGFMEKFHAWWVGADLQQLSESTDEYIHSSYTEMKKYIDRTLKDGEIFRR